MKVTPPPPPVRQYMYSLILLQHYILCSHTSQSHLQCRTVFVGSVPHHISDAELADYFCDVGEVLTVQIRGNDEAHYAFVEFA